MNTLKLGTIEDEAYACRAAWAAMPDAEYGVHIHHGFLAEDLSEPIENRINYILSDKPENERALRLRLMRPIPVRQWKVYEEAIATARKAYNEALNNLHSRICPTPGCPYKNGNIFERIARAVPGGS